MLVVELLFWRMGRIREMENVSTNEHINGRVGRLVRNKIKNLADNRIALWCVYALLAFPLIDYALRLPYVHPIGVIWDKVVFVVLAAVAVKRWFSGYRPGWFVWQKFAGWYVLFGMALLFAGMSHPIVAIDGYRIDVYYMFYTVLLPFVVEPKDVLKILHASAVVAILIGVHGVYQFITKAPIDPAWLDLGEHVRTRVFSVLTSPNELGSYMALMIPLLVGLFLYETNRLRKLFYGVGTLFCFATQLFTFDRGSLLSLALAVFVVAILFQRKLLIFLAILAVVAYFIPSIHHRFADLLSPIYFMKAAQGGRIARWLTAFDNMSSNPLFGIGLGRYGGQVASDFHLGIYSDGFYMKILGESGIIGLVLYLSLHIVLLREIVHKAVRLIEGRSKYVVLGGITGLLAVAVHNFIENVFEFAPMLIMYFNLATLFLIWGRGAKIEGVDSHQTE